MRINEADWVDDLPSLLDRPEARVRSPPAATIACARVVMLLLSGGMLHIKTAGAGRLVRSLDLPMNARRETLQGLSVPGAQEPSDSSD